MGDDLKTIRKGMSQAYSAMWKGRRGVELTHAVSKVHHIKAIEVTMGKNGYHPHFHALLFVEKELTEEHLELLREAWTHQVVRCLGPSFKPSAERGVTLECSHKDNYIAKIGLEVAGILDKSGKNGNLTMWQVADRAAGGDKWARRAWAEYTRAMHGCRRQVWSQGAKRYFGVPHLADIAIAEAPIGEKVGPLYVAAIWQGSLWDSLAKSHPYWVTRVVHAASGGSCALAELPRQLEWFTGGHVGETRPPLPPIPTRRGTSDRISVRGITPDPDRQVKSEVPIALRLAQDDSPSAWYVRVQRTGGKPGRTWRFYKPGGTHEDLAVHYAKTMRRKPGEWLCSIHQGLFGESRLVTVYRTEGGCIGIKNHAAGGSISDARP